MNTWIDQVFAFIFMSQQLIFRLWKNPTKTSTSLGTLCLSYQEISSLPKCWNAGTALTKYWQCVYLLLRRHLLLCRARLKVGRLCSAYHKAELGVAIQRCYLGRSDWPQKDWSDIINAKLLSIGKVHDSLWRKQLLFWLIFWKNVWSEGTNLTNNSHNRSSSKAAWINIGLGLILINVGVGLRSV